MARISDKTKTTLLILITTFVIGIFTACDNGGDCNINNVSYNHIHFYTIDSESEKENKATYNGILTASLVINGKDSIVVNHIADASNLAIPLSYTNECDTLLLQYEDGTQDSMFVGHTNIPFFISMDCGVGMYHNLTEVRHTNIQIDSVAIVHSYINFDAHENIKLYFIE